ncbi:hypothetical protein Brsp04_02817 [Brucella sp. NBRC 12952]
MFPAPTNYIKKLLVSDQDRSLESDSRPSRLPRLCLWISIAQMLLTSDKSYRRGLTVSELC